jgi:hypothetical protein
MDPIVARSFVDLGFTKRSLQAVRRERRLSARDYWDDQWISTLIRPLAVAGIEPYASRLKAAPDQLVNLFRADDIKIVVTGGETQGAFKMFAGRLQKPAPGNFLGGNPINIIDEWR